MKKLHVAMSIIVPIFLAGCGQGPGHNDKPVLSDGTTPVSWSSLPPSEQSAILAVAAHYGDARPKVVSLYETKTDPDQKLMYTVELSGLFQQGEVYSGDLEFSILGDGSFAWVIRNKAGTFGARVGADLRLH